VTDDARPPLNAGQLRAALTAPWASLDVVDETESTNADLIGAPPGSVLVAEYQHAGRGRLDRAWTSPPRAGLLVSAAVALPVPSTTWGWLPLLTGVAVCDAVRAVTGLPVSLKWPNDLLIEDGKLGGILVQLAGDTAVIGLGLNVSTTRAELPLDTAVSLATAGATAERGELLSAILAQLGTRYLEWTGAGGDAVASGLAAAYRDRCATLGREVIVVAPPGERRARAIAVGDDGRLRVRWADAGPDGPDAEQALAAGDIVHLRVADRP
jgi:BirA family biotin operon repressor/biotin-[acetyl-CoA-carboxylase] ligase